jgi:hypothetical protein
MAPGQHYVVCIGIDHFWLWWANRERCDSLELKLLAGTRTLRMLRKV